MNAFWLAAALLAADDPATLAKSLGAEDFAVREDAEKRLRALGDAARPALEAAAKTKDLEVRRRAESLLRELRGGDLWQGSTVKFSPGTKTVREAFAELAAQSGNPVRWKENEPDAAAEVTLDATPRNYWEALRWLCAQTGTAADFPEDRRSPGVLLSKGKPGKFPAAIVGPLRLRVESVSRQTRATRYFVEDELSVQDDLQMVLELHWERRVGLARHSGRLRVLEARTVGGLDLKLPPPEGRNVPLAVRRGQAKQTFQHSLTPPPPGDAKLAKLRVALDAEIAGDFTVLTVPFRADAAGATGGWSASLLRLNDDPRDCLFTLRRPEPLGLPQASTDNADESIEIVGERDRMPMIARSIEHEALETKFRFTPPTTRFEPKRIEVRVAKARSARTVEFVLENISLVP